MALAMAVIALVLWGCGDRVSSPVAPKVVADGDSTVVEPAQCVVVNITGDNIQVHGASDVHIDTVAVSTDTINVQSGFQMLMLSFVTYADGLVWNSRREGWVYWDERVSADNVIGIFVREYDSSTVRDDLLDWTPFEEFVRDMDPQPSVEVNGQQHLRSRRERSVSIPL